MLVALVAVLLGAGAGYLARRDGASYPAAVMRAAAAFGATLGVVSAVTAAIAAVAALAG
ncbi:hypothetical protein OHA02_36000 [Streptomyces phaeochromogenes]|nr:hypothetical protein [Streptomyces phaeochromogenes]